MSVLTNQELPLWLQVLLGSGVLVWVLRQIKDIILSWRDRNQTLEEKLKELTIMRVEDCSRHRASCGEARNAAREEAFKVVQLQLRQGDDTMAWLTAAVRCIVHKLQISPQEIDSELAMNGRGRRRGD